jgi:hypothetical protein
LIAPPPTTVRQSRELARRTRELRARNEELFTRCANSIATALDNCEVSFELGHGSLPSTFQCTFLLRARVGDDRVLAVWRTNKLVIHPRLAERASLVIGLGERFKFNARRLSVAAGFESPLQAALTLMRAADEVLEFSFRADGLDFSYRSRASIGSGS